MSSSNTELDLYRFSSSQLLNWVTAFCLFEIPLAYFYLSISKKNDTVTNWYSGKTINIWNVIVQDMLYVVCGVIVALRIFGYLTSTKNIRNSFTNFVIVLICVQLIGDLTFATVIKSWPHSKSTKWINYFKNYVNKAGVNALFGDTLYVIVWALSYYFVTKYVKNYDTKVFIISLFCFLTSAYSVQ